MNQNLADEKPLLFGEKPQVRSPNDFKEKENENENGEKIKINNKTEEKGIIYNNSENNENDNEKGLLKAVKKDSNIINKSNNEFNIIADKIDVDKHSEKKIDNIVEGEIDRKKDDDINKTQSRINELENLETKNKNNLAGGIFNHSRENVLKQLKK